MRCISAVLSAAAALGLVVVSVPSAQAATGAAPARPVAQTASTAPMSVRDFHRKVQAQLRARPHRAVACGSVVIRSVTNGRYVSAELGYHGDRYGMLRARATEIGFWEVFV
jgi:hypothetical protein